MNVSERLALGVNKFTDRIRRLPVLVLSPHSRCNCRCLMCDIWRANANGIELSVEDLEPHVDKMRDMGVRMLVFSGGEPLMHRNLWALCVALRPLKAQIILLSTGLLLKRHASEVVNHCDEVILSLDGSPAVHDRIRNIPRAFERLAEGVQALREVKPDYPVSARCVLQRSNFRDLMNVIATARGLGLRRISFLAADVSSEAFNRPGGWDKERIDAVALNQAEVQEFATLIQNHRAELEALHRSGIVAESWPKLASLVEYFAALQNDSSFPLVTCNAPWVSAVLETNGDIRPCFFHPPYGSLDDGDLGQVLNSPAAIEFRRGLDVANNPVCQRCVCSLNL